MLEREFQGWIIDVAERFGWRIWHVPFPVRPIGGNKFIPEPRAKGLADLILVHIDPPRLIFAEVKGTGGKLSDAQREFLSLVAAVGKISHAVDVHGLLEPGLRRGGRTLAAYDWQPGMEDVIETVLRSKVLV